MNFVILIALIASYVLKSIFKSTQNHLKTLWIFSPKLTCSFPEKCILSKSMFVCVQIQQKSFLSFKTSTKCWRKKVLFTYCVSKVYQFKRTSD